MDPECLPSGLVGRRRRHEAGGGIARRGQFLVFGIVIGGGIELLGAVVESRDQRHLGADRPRLRRRTSPSAVSGAPSPSPATGSGNCRLRSLSDLISASGGRSSMDFSEK